MEQKIKRVFSCQKTGIQTVLHLTDTAYNQTINALREGQMTGSEIHNVKKEPKKSKRAKKDLK